MPVKVCAAVCHGVWSCRFSGGVDAGERRRAAVPVRRRHHQQGVDEQGDQRSRARAGRHHRVAVCGLCEAGRADVVGGRRHVARAGRHGQRS